MPSLQRHEGEFHRALARLERRTKFAEILAESAEGETTRVDRKSVSDSVEPRLRGAVLRAWGGERWVESATSALDPVSIRRAAEAIEQSLAASSGSNPPPSEPSSTRREWTRPPPRPMRDLEVEETIDLGRDVHAWAREVPGIQDCAVTLAWDDTERFYVNTSGARCHTVIPRVRYAVAAIAVENGRVEFDFLADGVEGGRDLLDTLTAERIRALALGAVELLHAKTPPSGEMTVLMDPGVTGIFAHESFGHGTEADQFVRDRSYLKPMLGSVVGPPELTLADDGTYPGGWGTIYVDDEGCPAQRTVLIDRGRFVSGIHDRSTAAALGSRPTGNSRRSDFLSRLFVRMTNTFVDPGDWSFEELVREAKNGVLLERATSGVEDPQGGQMQLKVKKGRRIENGELTDRLSSMALSGKVLDVLRATRGVGRKEYLVMDAGACGKGHTDLLPVGSGGSYLLTRAIVGPA